MSRRLLPMFALFLLLGGCAGFSLFPQHSEMREIHDLYRKEFASRFLPQHGTNVKGVDIPKGEEPARPFSRTLSKIRSFQLRYPDNNVENSHLIVLEGMIYLQIGELASAGLIASSKEFGAAPGHLSGNGAYAARDKLFANNFVTLIDAWKLSVPESIGIGVKRKDAEKQLSNPGAAIEVADKLCNALVTLEEGANGLCGANIRLFNPPDSLDKTPLAKSDEPTLKTQVAVALREGDDGPIYVAATGAIAYLFAFERNLYRCDTKKLMEADGFDDWNKCKKSFGDRYHCAARNLIGRFLNPRDRKQAKKLAAAGKNREHFRYLRLYAQLDEKCSKALAS